MQTAFARLPLHFEANHGQTNARVKFLARGPGYTLFLTGDEAVLSLRGSAPAKTNAECGMQNAECGTSRPLAPSRDTQHATRNTVMRMKLAGANRHAPVAGAEELPGKLHYFRGNDRTKWHANVPTYGKVRYRGVYPGIDLVYYGNQGQLEYDFLVAPGADPGKIRLSFHGAGGLHLDRTGDLVLTAGGHTMRLRRPIAYQESRGRRRHVPAAFVLSGPARPNGATRVSFRVARYDRARPLVVDPVFVYSTRIGGSGEDTAPGVAVDASGAAYIVGTAAAADFPVTASAYRLSWAGIVVFKLSPDGTALAYATYLGGSSTERPDGGIVVDGQGNAYVAGHTTSTDFTTTPGVIQSSLSSGVSAFVAKVSPDGSSLVFSTYLGGSGGGTWGGAVAVDVSGSVYVTGSTYATAFPSTAGVFQPAHAGGGDAFLTKLSPDATQIVHSGYLGGTAFETAGGLAVDAAGNAYVCGTTASGNFPLQSASQTQYGGGTGDAFVAKVDASGSGLLYSTYLGGTGKEDGWVLALDPAGNAYAAGRTASSDFPTTLGTRTFMGVNDAFAAAYSPSGALLYATCLGGTADDYANRGAVDAAGNLYLAGDTTSANFPAVGDTFTVQSRDAHLSILNPLGLLVFSTVFGGTGNDIARGLAVDAAGDAYVSGSTYGGGASFPLGPNDPNGIGVLGGSADIFVSKIHPAPFARLAFVVAPADGSQAGVPFAPAIKVGLYDGQGNLMATANDPVTLAIRANPAGGTLSGTTTVNAIDGMATFDGLSIDTPSAAPYTLIATAACSTATLSAPFTVLLGDTAPTLAPVADQETPEGNTVNVGLSGADADGDALTYAAIGLPAGLSVHPTTGAISGTVSYTAAAGSPYHVTVTVIDNTPGGPLGDSASRTFAWSVSDTDTSPTLAAQPDQSHFEGQSVNVLLAGAGDVDGDALAWSAAGLPPGLSLSSSGRVTGRPSSTASADSPYAVTVTVTDNTPGGAEGDSAGRAFLWTIRRPTLTVTSPNGGETWSIGASATIIWESAGVGGPVKIDLSRDGGAIWQALTPTGVPNTGSFAWTVTGTQMTSRALVRVTSLLNRSVSDGSDAPFHILHSYGDSQAAFHLSDGFAAAGARVSLPLRCTANGAAVTTATFDVVYDPTLLAFVQALPPTLAGTRVAARVKRAGRVGIVITDFPAGVWEDDDLAVLVFQTAASAVPGGSTPVALMLPDTDAPGVEVLDGAVPGGAARAEGRGGSVHFGAYGDLNGNGIVDVGDVQVMKNVLLNLVPFNAALHDLDFNGGKDAGDLDALIDLFLYQGAGTAPAAPVAAPLQPQALASEADIDYSTGTNRITAIAFALKAAVRAGEVSYVPPAGAPARDDLRLLRGQLADGTVRVILYSDTRTPLPSFGSFHVRLKAPTSQTVRPERPSSPGSIGYDGALANGTLVAVEYVAPPVAPVIKSCRAVATTEVQLTWGPVAGAVSYDVFRGEPWSETPLANVRASGAADLTYRDVRLEGRTGVVKYRVRARNVGGRLSAYSAVRSVTVLPAPTIEPATALSSTQVLVKWQYTAPGATAFAVERKAATGDWAGVGAAGAADRSKTVSAAPGSYSYRVKATNAAAVSSPSSASTLTVLPPVTALQARALSSSEVQLDWSFPAGITGHTFVVERLAPGATVYTVVTTAAAGTLRCSDKRAVAGACLYRVRARNSRGISTGPVVSITVLAAPTGLTAALLPARQVKMDWVDNSAGEMGFKIERFDNGAATPAATASVGANVHTKTLTVPRAGDYAFRVRAYNSRGFSSYSNTRSVRVE